MADTHNIKPLLPTTICLLALVLITGCGGSPRDVAFHPSLPQQQESAPATTGHPYYPLTEGTYAAYSIRQIARAHFDYTAYEIIVDEYRQEPSPHGSHLIMQYSQGSACVAAKVQPYYMIEWAFTNSSAPLSSPIKIPQTLGDVKAVSSSGIPYIGEAVQADWGTEDHPEPLITMNPVAGERIFELTTVRSCADANVIREEDFGLEYTTVRHHETWQGFSDVWQTSLIELHQGAQPIYYNFFFARNIGLVGFSCWTISPDYLSCGNEYTAVN